MSVTFQKYLTDCLIALGDSSGSTWSRTNTVIYWALEAIVSFPILRPMKDDHTNGASVVYSLALPVDFREIIDVEYPISQTPPVYLVRKNRLDPDFYSSDGSYDVDHDYSTGKGWMLYISGGVAALAHIYTQYLANHDTAMVDDDSHYLSIPDEYENILIASVICRAYRERLSYYMQDPTAHMTIITQMTTMVAKSEENFRLLVEAAQAKLAQSKVSAHQTSDKFDRVY
jgi:hypothetical protein